MGKNDDWVNRAAQNAMKPQQPQLQVATPQTWEQLVAWTAAMIYGKSLMLASPVDEEDAMATGAVNLAVQIVAKSAAAVSSGVLRDAAKAEVARLEQEQADQGNPSTAQN
jgi:hypothetical protein